MMLASRDIVVAAILDYLGRGGLLPLDDVRARSARDRRRRSGGTRLAQVELAVDNGWTLPAGSTGAAAASPLADRFLERGSVDRRAASSPRRGRAGAAHDLRQPSLLRGRERRGRAAAARGREPARRAPDGDRRTEKAFTSRERRFSSLCFGTVKVPQSTEVSSGEAQLTAREGGACGAAGRSASRSTGCPATTRSCCSARARGAARRRCGRCSRVSRGTHAARHVDAAGRPHRPRVALSGRFHDRTSARVTMRIGAPLRAVDLFARAGGNRRVVDGRDRSGDRRAPAAGVSWRLRR